jgi:tRNA-dihydrouridine synthase
MRKHAAWYVHGLPEAAAMRARVYRAATYEEMDAVLAEYGEWLAQYEDEVGNRHSAPDGSPGA